MTWLAIAVGGAIGALARHLTVLATLRWYGEVVPLAVAIVNLTGCLGIGAALGLLTSGQWTPGEPARVFVFVGVLGGFTTFSSFGLDTFILLRDGRTVVALANAAGQLLGGVAAVIAGYALTSR